jgi:aryl-alcohol dehydrogenase-like predicted oxidoreductase/AcrR family transcriptional regulator
MEAVAQAAGITKSTLYARYADKPTLFIAVCSWALTRQEPDERVLEPLPDDLAAALTVIARAILARSVDPGLVRLNRMAIAESARFPEFAASTQAVAWTPRIRVIMDLLRRHERAGTVVVTDLELAAEQFFAMVGAMPAWLAAYGIFREPEVEEEHIRHAVALFVNGVLVRAPLPVEGGHRLETTQGEAGDTTAPVDLRPVPIGTMEHRRLGRSGLYVSELALGTMVFGMPGRSGDEQTVTELVHRYVDAGGNLIDTSDLYGASEEMYGRAVRDRRSKVVLATKVRMPAGRGHHGGGNSRRHIRAACEASLRRLQTDYIDLYQIQVDDPATPLEETIGALDDLVRAGKVLYIGASNLRAHRLMKALSVSDRMGAARFISLQGRYDLMVRSLEREHLPLLEEEGLGLISESPLATDLLTMSGNGATAAAMQKAATELGCTIAQLMLAWQRTKPVTAQIIDARTATQLEDSLAALSIEIPAEITAELDQVTRLSDP